MSLYTDGTNIHLPTAHVVPGILVPLLKKYENDFYNGPPVRHDLPPVDQVQSGVKPAHGLGDETSYKIHQQLKKLLDAKTENKTLLAVRDWR